MSSVIVYASEARWKSAAARLERLLAGDGFRPVKRTRRTLAGFLEFEGVSAFVKRVDEGGWLKGWMTRLRGSRARRALRGGAMLEAAGFSYPRPLLAVEARRLGAIRASYVVSEALGEAQVLSKIALAGGRRAFRQRSVISRVVAREIRRLHDAGIYTRDLQETNLLLRGAGGANEWTIIFVDLEDFRRARSVTERHRMLNLVHLDRTIGRYLPKTQRLRFFYNYLGRRPAPDEARALVRRLIASRARAERRALRRAGAGVAGASRVITSDKRVAARD